MQRLFCPFFFLRKVINIFYFFFFFFTFLHSEGFTDSGGTVTDFCFSSPLIYTYVKIRQSTIQDLFFCATSQSCDEWTFSTRAREKVACLVPRRVWNTTHLRQSFDIRIALTLEMMRELSQGSNGGLSGRRRSVPSTLWPRETSDGKNNHSANKDFWLEPLRYCKPCG